MVVRFPHSLSVAAVVVLSVIVAGCGSPETPATEASEAPQTPDAASVADSLTPTRAVLRGIECHRGLNNARRIAERLPADLVTRIGDNPKISFADLTFVGRDLDITMDMRRDASNSGRAAPEPDAPVTSDYLTYVDECLAITDRVIAIRAAEKAGS